MISYGDPPPLTVRANQLKAPTQALPLPVITAPVSGAPIVITTLSETAPQGPAGSSVVKVKVTVPAVLSAALGV
jgi:hypothetical protein